MKLYRLLQVRRVITVKKIIIILPSHDRRYTRLN